VPLNPELVDAVESRPAGVTHLGALSRDVAARLAPKDEVSERDIRDVRVQLARLGRRSADVAVDDSFRSGALFALREVLAAASAGLRARRVHQASELVDRPLRERVLDLLRSREPAALRPSEIVAELSADPSQVSRALRGLADAELVEVVAAAPEDDGRRRYYRSSATPGLKGSDPHAGWDDYVSRSRSDQPGLQGAMLSFSSNSTVHPVSSSADRESDDVSAMPLLLRMPPSIKQDLDISSVPDREYGRTNLNG